MSFAKTTMEILTHLLTSENHSGQRILYPDGLYTNSDNGENKIQDIRTSSIFIGIVDDA